MNASDAITMGLVLDMPAERYHSVAAMSASGLKQIQQSPAHYFGMYLDPAKPVEKKSAAKANGTLAHCLLLEPHAFDQRYIVVPEDAPTRPSTRQRKAAKPSEKTVADIHWWDNFDALAAGRIIVDAEPLESARVQASRVRALPDIAALLADGFGEASAFWIDELTGELCKCRPDWTSPAGDGVIIVDGKTCQDASPDGFGRTVWNFDYHLQAAWYSDGYEKATGKRVHGFVFAAVESSWPHAAAAYMLGDDVLDRARAENRRLLNLYAECRRTGIWPGYQQTVQSISLPAWAK